MEKGKKKQELKIGYLPILDHLTLGIAAKKGKFKKVDLKPIKIKNWNVIYDAMKKGSLDGSFVLAQMGIKLRSEGVPIKIVLLGHREGQVVVLRNGLNSLSELKGKRMGVPHKYSTHNLFLHQLLKENGLEHGKDVEVVYITPGTIIGRLEKGEIDGFISAEPFGTMAELKGVGKVITLSKDIAEHHVDCVLAMREDVIEKKSGAVQELVQEMVKAGIFAHQNPVETKSITNEFVGPFPEPLKERVSLDDTDFRLLSAIQLNARANNYELAEAINSTPAVVKYHLEKLRNGNIIQGFTLDLNASKLGFQQIKAFLQIQSIELEKLNRLISFISSQPEVFRVTKLIGFSELEIDLMVERIREFDDLMKRLRSKFPAAVRNYQFMPIYSEQQKPFYFG